MSDSSRDDNLIRRDAEDLAPPQEAELRRLRDLSDAEINTDEIPDIGDVRMADAQLICLRLDPETVRLLRTKGDFATQLRRAIREYAHRQSEDAA